jgi:hypothetical protein
MVVGINFWAVLVAAFVNFVLGGLWYSPLLFVKPWLAMSGVSKEVFDASIAKGIVVEAISSLVMAFVLAMAIPAVGAVGLATGLLIGFLLWLGFVATVLLGQITHEHKPFGYFAINAGYRLVAMLAMGATLALWR